MEVLASPIFWRQMVEVVLTILGLILTLATMIKLLLNEYFKKAKEVEELKNNYQQSNINELKNAIDEFKKELRNLKLSLEDSIQKSKQNNDNIKDITQKLDKYTEKSDYRISKIESTIIEIGKNLFIIKGNKCAESK